jgi:hypothetical protein
VKMPGRLPAGEPARAQAEPPTETKRRLERLHRIRRGVERFETELDRLRGTKRSKCRYRRGARRRHCR